MGIKWEMMFTIFLAIIGASLVEHLVIAPRMAHSPGKTLPSATPVARTAEDWIKQNFPNAVTV